MASEQEREISAAEQAELDELDNPTPETPKTLEEWMNYIGISLLATGIGYVLSLLGGMTYDAFQENFDDEGSIVYVPRPESVWAVEVKGAISPASSDYIISNLEEAEAAGAELFVIKLDTPGGLDQSMRSIIKAILASSVPVATWVAPSGGRAASAGTYILYASHIAAMAPATNLGAATPVNLGAPNGSPPADTDSKSDDGKQSVGDKGEKGEKIAEQAKDGILGLDKMSAMERKATQDAVAYIRGLAQLRGRNVDWAEAAVGQASSLPAEDALEKGVIDIIAADIDTLLRAINGREVKWNKQGETRVVELTNYLVKYVVPDWRDIFLAFVSNPNFAFMLLSLGAWGLLLELYSPGVGLPMVVGLIALALGLYGLQMLPVSTVGLLLLALGLALMVAEVFAPSFGVFGIGGMIAFAVGGVFLMDTDQPEFQISLYLISGITLATAVVSIGGGMLAVKVLRRRSVTGADSMLGGEARVLADFDAEGRGRVQVFGESWQAKVAPTSPIPKTGDILYVHSVDSLVLKVSREPTDTEGVIGNDAPVGIS